MEDTYNFYIDKKHSNKYNTELSVIPHHPIINDQDDSIVKIKLLDFKFLNTFYNISSTLVNNQFNIRRTSKTYTYEYGSSVLYFCNWRFTGLFFDVLNLTDLNVLYLFKVWIGSFLFLETSLF